MEQVKLLKLRNTAKTSKQKHPNEDSPPSSEKKSQDPDRPIHTPFDSLFSPSSGFKNFEGFVNWGILVLIIGGSRLLLENYIKYGIRVDPREWIILFFGASSTYPQSFILLAYANVHIIVSLVIEKRLAANQISFQGRTLIQIINLLWLILTPILIFYIWDTKTFSLIGAGTVCFCYPIAFLKLWSYIQVNGWCREGTDIKESDRDGSGSSTDLASTKKTKYPNNLTLVDLYYFMFAPTLCYELNFPRTPRIRKMFVLKRLAELIFGGQLVLALTQQWIIPLVKNSLVPFSNMEIFKMQERLLKLSVPTHLIWLILFYIFFHCYLNILGELLRFSDRKFYLDWWNAPDVETFWRKWNMPVHRWCVRHLYVPVIKRTGSKVVASISVFFFSALFHEFLVSVPLRIFQVWFFLGMMSQIPLSLLSKFVSGKYPRVGNIVTWYSCVLGLPIIVMMYYHDYVMTHFPGQDWVETFAKID